MLTVRCAGTDEYGTSTEVRALKEKCTPQELCDKFYAIHSQVYEWFNISFDVFGRTTTRQQTEITQDIFLKLKSRGLLHEHTTAQLFCNEHHAFLADRLVEGKCPLCGYGDARGDQCDRCGKLLDPLELIQPRCKVDGSAPTTRDTNHVFFALDKLQPEIETLFHDVSGGWPGTAKSITAAWLREGLRPRSITRDIRWGTPVPLSGYENKAIYPWFDACIGYASITAGYTERWEEWWRNPDVQLYQFIGKDNVVFHSVIFPATQIGTGDLWTKLHHLSATDYLMYEGDKFSKGRGIGVFGDSVQHTGVSADVWRFYLLSCRPETGDSEFTWDGLVSANNNMLLKNVGNFVSRVLRFVAKHYDGIPEWTGDLGLKDEVNGLLVQYINELDAVKLRAGLSTALRVSHCGNAFLQSNKLDSRLFAEEPTRCAAVVGLAVNLVHLLAALLAPYMPDTAAAINLQLNTGPLPVQDHWDADSIKPGHEIGMPEHLFRRIDPAKAKEWRKAFNKGQGSSEV
jgi:methionyl-tRNA synthetase